MAGLVGRITIRNISPRSPGAQHPHYSVQDRTAILPWSSAPIVARLRLRNEIVQDFPLWFSKVTGFSESHGVLLQGGALLLLKFVLTSWRLTDGPNERSALCCSPDALGCGGVLFRLGLAKSTSSSRDAYQPGTTGVAWVHCPPWQHPIKVPWDGTSFIDRKIQHGLTLRKGRTLIPRSTVPWNCTAFHKARTSLRCPYR
jgi:hypothetical protein